METKMDALGRVVVPKALRDALGLEPGVRMDISWYDGGLRLIVGGRTARLVTAPDGGLVAESDQQITDDTVFGLVDAGRR